MRRLLIVLFYLLFLVHQLYAQERIARDSVIVSAVSGYMNYCTSNDSALEFAEKMGIPVKYPLLVVNGVVIRNKKDVDTIRNSIHGDKKRLLGPYHIVQRKIYSREQSIPFQINGIPLDGVVIIVKTLKENTIE